MDYSVNGQISMMDYLAALPMAAGQEKGRIQFVPEKELAPVPAKVSADFGEHIGGARKEIWAARGLMVSDLECMNAAEKAKHIKKDNVWKKPDYEAMIGEGTPVLVAYAIKKIRDALPVKPVLPYKASEERIEKAQQGYIEFVSAVRDMAMKMEESNLLNIKADFLVKGGYITQSGMYSVTPTEKCHGCMSNKLYKAMNLTSRMLASYQYDIASTQFGVKAKDKEPSATKKNGKRYFLPPQLTDIQRYGLADVRSGRNITGQDFLDDFKIRGGEFGNWMNEADAQASLNMGYEALCDFADVLGITPDRVSFGGKLAIAFGARGKGKACAHYETLREVINLTKMKGAGSLGHELFHALDDIIGKRLGLNKMMTNANFAEIPASVKRVLDVMKYKEATPEEKRAAEEKNRKQASARLIREVDYLLPDSRLTDEQKSLKTSVIEELMKPYECSGMEHVTGEFPPAIEKLSELKKQATGHVIPKESRTNLFWVYMNYQNKIKPIEGMRVYTDFYKNSKKMDELYCKDSYGYWASECEMFARAGACYLTDMIAEKGGVSDYLSGHSESAIGISTGPDGDIELVKAIPQGDERAAINAAIKEMIADLKNQGLL